MRKFAPNTTVSSKKSRLEIERTVYKYGAKKFAFGSDELTSYIGFELENRRILFNLPILDRFDREFTETPTGIKRTSLQAQRAWKQATRQTWRALNLVIKAKLEAVASKICTVQGEFLNNILMPNGQTVGANIHANIDEAYETGIMPKLLPYDQKD